MQLPFFYIDHFNPSEKIITLDEDNSRHIVQVLRMQGSERLHLTDGKGNLLTAEIEEAHKKHCTVRLVSNDFTDFAKPEITIAISLLKNNNRFEWFLEKATEIGVNNIVPLICSRTEKQKTRLDRLKNILVSAMLQSRQTWLPLLQEPVAFKDFIETEKFKKAEQKFIAHCIDGDKQPLKTASRPSIILIGPEGDFTPDEIKAALETNYRPVTLGATRLRAETAGVVAAGLLRIG